MRNYSFYILQACNYLFGQLFNYSGREGFGSAPICLPCNSHHSAYCWQEREGTEKRKEKLLEKEREKKEGKEGKKKRKKGGKEEEKEAEERKKSRHRGGID